VSQKPAAAYNATRPSATAAHRIHRNLNECMSRFSSTSDADQREG
jgi:hypothetical protein